MPGDKYLISDQHSTYFITCTVIKWIDLFSRKDYKDAIIDSMNYCIKEKHVTIYSWVIMSNHLHMIARCDSPGAMSGFLRDFKKFTSKRFIEIIEGSNESRAEWLLDKFSFEARRTRRAENYKVWKDDNHALDLYQYNIDIMEKINYIHENPVRSGLVEYPDHYIYSSAKDYAGAKGLVKVTVI